MLSMLFFRSFGKPNAAGFCLNWVGLFATGTLFTLCTVSVPLEISLFGSASVWRGTMSCASLLTKLLL